MQSNTVCPKLVEFAYLNSEITNAALNFESESLFQKQLKDGINEMTEQVTIYVINDNEAPP